MRPEAMASRAVTALPPTSTMRAAPASSMWVRPVIRRSARVAASTSSWRISASPIRKQWTSCSAIASSSARVVRPLSATKVQSFGRLADEFVGALEIDREVAQVAVVDADQARLELQRALHLVRVVDLDQHVHAAFERGGLDLGHLDVVERGDDDAGCSRRRSRAPRSTCHGSTMKSLRRTGIDTASRAAVR